MPCSFRKGLESSSLLITPFCIERFPAPSGFLASSDLGLGQKSDFDGMLRMHPQCMIPALWAYGRYALNFCLVNWVPYSADD